MPQPIGGYGRSAYVQQPEEHSNAGLDFCRNANTVTEGFLCDEATVVSNACRSATNAIDAFVCDDRRMADLQRSVWDTTKDVLKTLFGALVGGKR
jgi:hypothetical protein